MPVVMQCDPLMFFLSHPPIKTHLTCLCNNLSKYVHSFKKDEDILALSGGGDWHMAYMLMYRAVTVPPHA